tara:strand:- start:1145 stop:2266 length:1122 start_codon:yes stop_codon:yes gene_type:complete
MELETNSYHETNYMQDGFIINKDTGSEEVILIPYNKENILVNEDNIKAILDTNNVSVDKINKIERFQQAFTHKSYVKKDIFPEEVLIASKKELGNPKNLLELREESYERLEYLGDRVLKLICSFYLFYRYPEEDEGFMTRLQTKIEDKTNLAAMSKKIGLGKYFIISQQIESLNGRTLEKLHEDVFESFLGALFLSNGFEPCCLLIINLLETLIDYSDKLYRDNNYKDILLRYYHKQKFIHPKYHKIHEDGPPHKRTYIMGVEKGSSEVLDSSDPREICVGFGEGLSKKEGEQNAAKMALITYGYLKDDQYSNTDLFYPNWEEIDASKNKSQEDSDDNYDYDNSNEINKLEDEHEINEEVFLKAYNESEEDSD